MPSSTRWKGSGHEAINLAHRLLAGMSLATSPCRIAALAGRRIDAPDAEDVRFPLDYVEEVESQLRLRFKADQVDVLVCSAACGADLVGLKVAAALGIERLIVLPFDEPRFLQSSVSDRPGDWAPLFHRQIEEARREGKLILLAGTPDDARSYSAATQRVILEVKQRINLSRAVGYVLWEGRPRPDHDETADFRESCVIAGFEIQDVRTSPG